jgi:hypothetical protein
MNSFVKFLLTVIVIVGLIMGVYQVWQYWGNFSHTNESSSSSSSAASAPQVQDSSLPGMSPKLEPMLDAARQRGATGLHDFLLTYGKTIADPRLASIQLDYVVLVAKDNPAEARRIFSQVKARTPKTSAVYPRVQMLEKTYE